MTERLPPHDINTEEAVLGGIIIDPPAIHDVPFLEPHHFFSVRNRDTFAEMRRMQAAMEPVDLITLATNMAKGGEDAEVLAYIIGLMNVVPTATLTAQYGRQVYDLAKRRELISAAGELADLAFDMDNAVDDALATAQGIVLDVAADRFSGGVQSAHDAAYAMMDEIMDRVARVSSGEEIFMKSGLADVDRIIDGFSNGDLIVIAGRPGMGKSLLESAIRFNVARSGKVVLSFNLEMTAQQLMLRTAASVSHIDHGKLRRGELSEDDLRALGAASTQIAELPMFIDDTPAVSAGYIHAAARRIQAQYGLDLITVDHLGLMSSDRQYASRNNEVQAISWGLKALAKDLDVPVVALSQLSRGCEQRQDKRPMLSDLRDSGAIEQDASLVLFVYRDGYYNEFAEPEVLATMETNIAKNRHGETGRVELYYDPARGRVANKAKEVVQL